QVGFSLVLEGGFDDAGAAAAHARGVGQGNVLGVAGSVLIDGDQIRNTAALDELGAHSVARRLGRDHDHVQVSTRHYLVVVDRETVGEGHDGAFLQIRLQLILVQLALEFVRGQNHYQVSSGDCSGHISHFQAVGFSFGDRRRTGTQTDSDIYTGVLEVARMG